MSSVVKKYLRGSAVGIVGKAVTLGAGYGTLYLLNRILSQNGYGSYTTMLAVATVLALVVQFGLRQSTIQRVSELSTRDERGYENYVGTAILVVTVASIVGVGGFLALAERFATLLGTQ